jgi:hypothetical protein
MLAVYAIAETLAQQSKLPLRQLPTIILPKLSKQIDPLKTFLFLRKKLLYFIGISTTITLIGIVLAPFIIRILFPHEYEASIIYAQFLFLAFIFSMSTAVFRNYLTAQGRTRSLYKSTTYPSLAKIIFYAALLPLIGIWGAVITFILGYYLEFGLLFYLSGKEASFTS